MIAETFLQAKTLNPPFDNFIDFEIIFNVSLVSNI